MENQRIVHGWKALAFMLKMSESKVKRYKAELLENKVIFYARVGKAHRRRLCFWPSEVIRWTGLKGKRGEII
jgi:hypothetical protein